MKPILFIAFALVVGACSSPAERFCAKLRACDGDGSPTEAECLEKAEREFTMVETKDGACDPVRAAFEDYLSCMTAQTCDDFANFFDRPSTCEEEAGALNAAEDEAEPECRW